MASKFNEQQMKLFKDLFKKFDPDNSGSFSISELKNVFAALNINTTENDLKALMAKLGKNASEEVNFEEFISLMADDFNLKPTRKDLENVFRSYDKDNSGYITEDELYLAIRRFKKEIQKNEINKLINMVDKDYDGKLDFDEFLALMDLV